MGCLPLNAIAVIRIHCANQFSEAGSCAFVGAGGELQGTLRDIARARARLSETLLWKERLKLMRLLIESHRLSCRHLCRPLNLQIPRINATIYAATTAAENTRIIRRSCGKILSGLPLIRRAKPGA